MVGCCRQTFSLLNQSSFSEVENTVGQATVLRSFCAISSRPAGFLVLPGRRKLDTSVTETSICQLKGVWSHRQEKKNLLNFVLEHFYFCQLRGVFFLQCLCENEEEEKREPTLGWPSPCLVSSSLTSMGMMASLTASAFSGVASDCRCETSSSECVWV